MEIEELEKRINWLDAERQKDKKAIAELSDAIELIKEENAKYIQKIKALELEIKPLKSITGRVDKVDSDFLEYKTSITKQVSEYDKKLYAVETKLEKQQKSEIDLLNKRIQEYQMDVKVIPELRRAIQARVDEDLMLNQKIDDISKLFPDLNRIDAEIQHQQKMLSNDLLIENKRVSDLQIETSAIRNRIEEDRNKIDLYSEAIRKIENRVNEIVKSEMERKQDQIAFIEKQSLTFVEKENLWKEWQKKFSELETISGVLNTQILSLEETHRSVKRSQEEFDEVNERFNRRINEISEINRLSEDRFRQEWVSFKADDQKRWTNYNLNRDEETRDIDRQVTKIGDRLEALEDLTHETQDELHLLIEESQKQLKSLANLSQDLLDSFAQTTGKRA